jgi:hypothetical protein
MELPFGKYEFWFFRRTNGSPQGGSPTSELMVVELSGRGRPLCPPAGNLIIKSILKPEDINFINRGK